MGLLIFNILPVYPLDGGQILRSLLRFVLGRARSLMVATILGFVGIVAFIGLAFLTRDIWLGVIAVFLLIELLGRMRHAQALLRFAKSVAPGGVCLPRVQDLRRRSATSGGAGELRTALRHFRDSRRLSQL